MMADDTRGFNQWLTRPADERFDSLEHLLRHCRNQRRNSAVRPDVDLRDLRVVNNGGDIQFAGKNGSATADMTSWAFNQLCQRIGFAPSSARSMMEWEQAEAVAATLNGGLAAASRENGDPVVQMLIDTEDGLTIRSINGQGYGRMWNEDVVSRIIMPLQQDGWRTPPARPVTSDQPGTRVATEDDVLVYGDGDGAGMGLSVKVGDLIAPAGLYAGVEDLWVIQVNTDKRIETGAGAGLYRALVFQNSEVGKSKVKVTGIGFDSICGNHILWGSQVLGEVGIIHRGDKVTERAVAELGAAATRFLNMPSSVEENAILSARTTSLGVNKEQVVDSLFGKRIASRKALNGAFDLAVEFETDHRAAPTSAWGMASGLTRLSQDEQYADSRNATDSAATKVLALAL